MLWIIFLLIFSLVSCAENKIDDVVTNSIILNTISETEEIEETTAFDDCEILDMSDADRIIIRSNFTPGAELSLENGAEDFEFVTRLLIGRLLILKDSGSGVRARACPFGGCYIEFKYSDTSHILWLAGDGCPGILYQGHESEGYLEISDNSYQELVDFIYSYGIQTQDHRALLDLS